MQFKKKWKFKLNNSDISAGKNRRCMAGILEASHTLVSGGSKTPLPPCLFEFALPSCRVPNDSIHSFLCFYVFFSLFFLFDSHFLWALTTLNPTLEQGFWWLWIYYSSSWPQIAEYFKLTVMYNYSWHYVKLSLQCPVQFFFFGISFYFSL